MVGGPRRSALPTPASSPCRSRSCSPSISSTSTLVGIWEELLFRGPFIPTAAEGLSRLPDWVAPLGARVSSSATFALVHFSQGAHRLRSCSAAPRPNAPFADLDTGASRNARTARRLRAVVKAATRRSRRPTSARSDPTSALSGSAQQSAGVLDTATAIQIRAR